MRLTAKAFIVAGALPLTACASLPPECGDSNVTRLVAEVVQENFDYRMNFTSPEVDARALVLREETFDFSGVVTTRRASDDRPVHTCRAQLSVGFFDVGWKQDVESQELEASMPSQVVGAVIGGRHDTAGTNRQLAERKRVQQQSDEIGSKARASRQAFVSNPDNLIADRERQVLNISIEYTVAQTDDGQIAVEVFTR